MLEFVKKYIFFLVDKEDKKTIQEKVMVADHKGFLIAVLSISIYQFVMLLLNFIRKGWAWSGYVVPYRILYIVLAVASLLFCVALNHMYKHKTKTGPFFAVVILYLYVVLAWGIGISVLDSYVVPVIITFAYVVVTTAAFVTIEPWGYIGAALLATIALNVTLALYPNSEWSVSALINSTSAFVLASMVSIFTFYRRVNSFLLEMEVQDLNNELEAKAYIDDLTKLYNRRYLSERMTEELDYTENSSGIMLFDIDNFKKVNDTYGHLAGDQVLKTIGQIVLNLEGYTYCVRYGGEEVLVFFESISKESLYNHAEKVRKSVENEKIKLMDGLEIHVTISIGLSKAKKDITYNAMINQADDALYKAKKNGKNQSVWFE